MKRLFFLTLLTSLLVAGLGCGGAANSGNARIRFIHLVADGPALDVFADFSGDPLATGKVFKEAGSYQTTKSVAQNIDVLVSGTSNLVTSLPITPGQNEKLSFLLVGTNAGIGTLLLSDNTSAPATGSVKLRLVFAAPAVGPVDVYITAPADPLPLNPNFNDMAFGSQTGYLEGPAGSYRVRITGANNQTVILDSGTITLAAGNIKTWIAVDKNGGGLPLQGVLYTD
ncbi:MAG: DUF4397 domain-containing protein [Fimbriimonadaceae bacterium]|nr:DUF4397 domain-containing protein [Fimbriimonadaceae bacterium]